MVECGDFLPDETGCGRIGDGQSCYGPAPPSVSVSTASFSNPNGFQIDGEYILQRGALNGKAYWLRSTGGMYLRWASMWTQWVFDDDTIDTTTVAWIPARAESAYPNVGTFARAWIYGSTAGNNGVPIPSLTISYGTRRELASEPGAQAQCVDTPGWHNGYNGNNGFNCAFYHGIGWCADGAATAGSEWTLGERWSWPERNCCACGKPAPPRGSLHVHDDVRLILFKAMEILDLWCTTDVPQDRSTTPSSASTTTTAAGTPFVSRHVHPNRLFRLPPPPPLSSESLLSRCVVERCSIAWLNAVQ